MSSGERIVCDESLEDHFVDVDKLLALVRGHPAIYNLALKEHHNQDVLSKIWTEISKELNVPVQVCKTKWTNLKNGYNRYLRELKKTPSGSAQKKRKWHLFDAMSFLQPFSGPTRVMSSNLKSSSHQEASPSLAETAESQFNTETSYISETEHEVSSFENTAEFTPVRKKQKTAAEIVAAPMVDFLKAATEKKRQEEKEENPMLTFFKSLIPDTEILTTDNRRKFKFEVMKMLNHFIDQQQACSPPSHLSTPISPASNSCTSVSNHSTATYHELQNFWSSDEIQ